MTKTELVTALDFGSAEEARGLIKRLKGLPLIYKVGSELFLPEGPAIIEELKEAGGRIFLDLKFHDIPRTVAAAAHQAARLGVDMFTLHLSGGRAMIEAVREELEKLPAADRPIVLGVSVLTSFSEAGWAEVVSALGAPAGRQAPIGAVVQSLAGKAREWGTDGLVCSAHELQALGDLRTHLYTVVPGIRPAGLVSASDDQARVMTPKQASSLGARAIVVGRPITQAEDPRAMTEAILGELES